MWWILIRIASARSSNEYLQHMFSWRNNRNYPLTITKYPSLYLFHWPPLVVIEPRHEKTCYVICEQQRCRSACASAQSDQRLCCSLPRQYNTSSFYVQNFKPLASFCGCAGLFVSYLVENPKDRFSRDEAQLVPTLVANGRSQNVHHVL